jgi:hypothetical protein
VPEHGVGRSRIFVYPVATAHQEAAIGVGDYGADGQRVRAVGLPRQLHTRAPGLGQRLPHGGNGATLASPTHPDRFGAAGTLEPHYLTKSATELYFLAQLPITNTGS